MLVSLSGVYRLLNVLQLTRFHLLQTENEGLVLFRFMIACVIEGSEVTEELKRPVYVHCYLDPLLSVGLVSLHMFLSPVCISIIEIAKDGCT